MLRINNYKSDFSNRLGKGSYGTVFKGESRRDKSTKVAVKRLENDGDIFTENAWKEYGALQTVIGHRNIIRLLDFAETDQFLYIVMELCELGDLENYTKEKVPNVNQKLDIMFQCAKGLNYLHTLIPPVVHRDVKPENILMKSSSSGDTVKISDFGLAKVFDERTVKMLMSTVVGSLLYRAPELFVRGRKQYSASIDTFSLGLVYQAVFMYHPRKNPSFEPGLGTRGPLMPYGYKLHLDDKDKHPLPVLFELKSDDKAVNIEVKSLVTRMTLFKGECRPSMNQVESDIGTITQKNRGILPLREEVYQRCREELEEAYTQIEELESQLQTRTLDVRPKSRTPVSGKSVYQKKQEELGDPSIAKDTQLSEAYTGIKELESQLQTRTMDVRPKSKLSLSEQSHSTEKSSVPSATSEPDTDQTVFAGLGSGKYKLVKEVECGGRFIRKSIIINGKLWCADGRGITIYSKNLEKLGTKPHEGINNTTGLAFTNSNEIIVGCGDNYGLHSVNPDCRYNTRIAGGSYSDVSVHINNIYALEYNLCKILVFEHSQNQWVKCQEIPLKYSKVSVHDRLAVNRAGVCVSSFKNHTLSMYTLERQFLYNTGVEGEGPAGQLKHQRVCDMDGVGNMLVADSWNHRLQVCNSTQQWEIIDLAGEVKFPVHAVVDSQLQNIWVSSFSDILSKYQKI